MLMVRVSDPHEKTENTNAFIKLDFVYFGILYSPHFLLYLPIITFAKAIFFLSLGLN